LASKLASEESGAGDLRKAKAKLERDMTAMTSQHKAELDTLKQQFDTALQKAKAEQVWQKTHERRVIRSAVLSYK
jgi:hypothetical protein